MNNFDSFDRKSFRKANFESKKNNKKETITPYNKDEHRFSRISKQNIKKRKQEMEQEEKWDDWEDEIY